MDEIRDGYTRVSSILAQWDKFGHIDRSVVSNKAGIGTRAHKAIEMHVKGIIPILDEDISGYFLSYCKWEDSIKGIEILQPETRYYCDKLMITGQVDCIAKMPGQDIPVLVDFKTSVCCDSEMWALQGAFYHYLAKQAGITLSDEVLFLQLDKNGLSPKVHSFKITKELQGICISAYNCFKYLERWLQSREKQWQRLS